MRFFLALFCLGCIALLTPSCKPQAFSEKPKLSFISISPELVKEWQDSIIITVQYEDGDGDLGENDANVQNLFVVDKRIGIEYAFRVSQLAPSDADISIKGTLKVVLPNTALTDPTLSSEQVSYDVRMTDRAGNKSNTITTSAITIQPI